MILMIMIMIMILIRIIIIIIIIIMGLSVTPLVRGPSKLILLQLQPAACRAFHPSENPSLPRRLNAKQLMARSAALLHTTKTWPGRLAE